MTRTTTMEQDWIDNFPFLPSKAPFFIILQHASSVRHLKKMLCEWLPPNWRLPHEELIKMVEHWKTWYRPHYKGGTSDHIVRSHVDRLFSGRHRTFFYGLRDLYLEKLMENHPRSEALDKKREKISWLWLPRRKKLHLLFQGRTLGDVGRIGVLAPANTDQEEIWFLEFFFDHLKLTEELTHSLSKLPGVIHRFYCRDETALYIGLDGSQLKAYANLKTKPTHRLCIQPKFLPEVQRQLTAMGVPITIVEAEQA